MTVLETIKNYNLVDYKKTLKDVYGQTIDITNKDFNEQIILMESETKSLYIHFPTNSCEIVVIKGGK